MAETPNFNEERFYQSIKDQAKTIREHAFNHEQLIIIVGGITSIYKIYLEKEGNKVVKNVNLAFESVMELNLAVQIAYSNYRKENKNLWASIFGFAFSKVPQFDLKLLK